MTIDEFVSVAKVMAWPTLALISIVLFLPSLTALLENLANSLKIRTVKLKLMGVEVELLPEEVKAATGELLQDLADFATSLSQEDHKLFSDILLARGTKQVIELTPGFVRGNEIHDRYGRLRDHHLIRPKDGGRWQPDRYPIPTKFGLLIAKLRARS